jgi:hypothetical protein
MYPTPLIVVYQTRMELVLSKIRHWSQRGF